jgi:hypothetical protein
LFNSLTILSLLLCLATLALWVRSYWRFDELTERSGSTGRIPGFSSNFGEVSVSFFRLSPDVPESAIRWRYETYRADREYVNSTWVNRFPKSSCTSLLGFGYRVDDNAALGSSYRAAYFPHWFLVLLLAILPAIGLRSILGTRRENRAGLCPRCGYDLRATPDRCPECGTGLGGNESEGLNRR